MHIRSAALIVVLACSPALVSMPAHAATTCAGQRVTISGTAGADSLVGTPLRDVVSLGGGDDSFLALGGDDLVCGDGGTDTVSGEAGNDVIHGGAGNDRIDAGAGDDLVHGQAGKDTLGGADGNDTIVGGSAADYVYEGAGNDVLRGGGGRDYVSYSRSTSGIRVTRGAFVEGAGSDRLEGVETVEGTRHADQMSGTSGSNDFRGLAGADRLSGGGGADFLSASGGLIRAGAGNDFVQGGGTLRVLLGPGDDSARVAQGKVEVDGGTGGDVVALRTSSVDARFDGGDGYNQISLLDVKRPATVNIGTGTASWKGGRLDFAEVVNVIGTRRADLMIGSSAHDVLFGRGGPDVLRGRSGNDVLRGQAGKDYASGGVGTDVCRAEISSSCES